MEVPPVPSPAESVRCHSAGEGTCGSWRAIITLFLIFGRFTPKNFKAGGVALGHVSPMHPPTEFRAAIPNRAEQGYYGGSANN